MEMLNTGLKKYGINSAACMKRIICSYVKNAVQEKMARESASHFSRIVEGLSRSDWALEYVTGTGIDFAIRIGRSERSCENVFKKCKPSFWVF